MDTQGIINLAISALLALALFNVRQIFQRLDRLEGGNSRRDVEVASLRAGHSSTISRLDRIEQKLDRLLERELS